MSDTRVAPISGHAKLSSAWLARLGRNVDVAPVMGILDNVTAVDALARLLTEAIETKTSKDGRIDMRDVAAHVLSEMKRHPR